MSVSSTEGTIHQFEAGRYGGIVIVSFTLKLNQNITSNVADHIITGNYSLQELKPIKRSQIGGSNNRSTGNFISNISGNFSWTNYSTISSGAIFWLGYIYICGY